MCVGILYILRQGAFWGVKIIEPLNQYVSSIEMVKSQGDSIDACKDALDVIGFVDLEVDCRETQIKYYNINFIEIDLL